MLTATGEYRLDSTSRGDFVRSGGLSSTDTGNQVAAFLDGEPWAVDLMAAWARGIAAHRAWGFETPDDIVQETLLALVRNLRRGAFTGGDLRAYVRRIAKNLCVSSYRKARVRGEDVRLEDGGGTLESRDSGEEVDRRMTLAQVMERIGDECRQLLILAYLHGCSRREIGEVLGVSEAAARVRLFRCMEEARALES